MQLEALKSRALAVVAGLSLRTAALIAGGVLVLVLAGVGVWWWSAAMTERAEAAYAPALAALARTRGPEASAETRSSVAAQLEAALARYPSAPSAALAAYELGNLRYAERDWTRARAAYELAVAKAGSPTITRLARAGIGYTWEAEGNHGKAVEVFQAALAGVERGDFLFEELLLDLARAQEAAGRKDDAIATYQRFLKDAGTSARADEARRHLVRLNAAAS